MSNNLTIRIISAAWIFLATKIAFVSAANEVLFVFNNGFTTSSGAVCSSAEHARISAVFGKRRALRGSDSSVGNATVVDDSRELALTKCADKCQGYATGTCRAKGCEGLRNLAVDEENNRNLQVSCTTEINSLHSKLDTVMAGVSANCKTYMARSRRRATCFPDYKYGNVQGIRIWRIDGSNQYLHTNFVAPYGTVSICKSLYFNIETLTEPCVESVSYWFQGPNDYLREHLEVEAPYALFGDDGQVLKGRYLSTAGLYTVWMAPDYDYSIEPWFDIQVNNC